MPLPIAKHQLLYRRVGAIGQHECTNLFLSFFSISVVFISCFVLLMALLASFPIWLIS